MWEGIVEHLTIKQIICSIAQDIVYAHTTACWIKPCPHNQSTRAEVLLYLFHAAKHTINSDTVCRIATSITHNILDRFVENGNAYVPDSLARERIINCSCDNIDILDGKNTLHCTLMMVW